MKKNRKLFFLWLSIILCFLLMGSPAIILMDKSNFTFMHIPAIYVIVFILWILLCVLTFVGYKLKWGDEENEDDDK